MQSLSEPGIEDDRAGSAGRRDGIPTGAVGTLVGDKQCSDLNIQRLGDRDQRRKGRVRPPVLEGLNVLRVDSREYPKPLLRESFSSSKLSNAQTQTTRNLRQAGVRASL